MNVSFQKSKYTLVLTEHAKERMMMRDISIRKVKLIIESGRVKSKTTPNKYWVFEKKNKPNGNVCLSISIEKPHLIVITTLVNWRPTE